MSGLSKKIRTVLKNEEGKKLLENFIALFVLQGIGFLFPLITYPYLARIIGVNRFGEIAFALSIVVYFDTLIAYGFNYTAVREIAKNKDDIKKVSIIFSKVLVAKFVLFLIALILFTALVYSIPILFNNRVLLFLTFLYVPGAMLFPEWLFQGIQKMKYVTVLNFVSKLLFTCLVFFVIKKEEDYLYQPLFIALGYILSGAISLIIAYKKIGIRFIVPTFLEIKKVIYEGFSMFLTVFLPNLYTNFSITLLGSVGGTHATGIYSSGKKFVDICDSFSSVLSRTFFPFLARRIDKHGLYVWISGTVSVFMGIGLFVGADLIISIFYGIEFREAATVLKIMSISPFFLFLMNTYGTNYLVLKGREDILRNIVVFCSLFGFVLAWIAVSSYGYIGVAITVTSVWGVRGLLTWGYAKYLKV
ncbi:flippase [Myroides odoratimimus]|uniref:flippase n=1 Tax=Myroides odoratimimus TaxID=76832 RepID=UPI002DBF0A6B|nr:flippase [Myroides odoratimimus]MEC4008539.1 flippase [Myroides odoratimimus]